MFGALGGLMYPGYRARHRTVAQRCRADSAGLTERRSAGTTERAHRPGGRGCSRPQSVGSFDSVGQRWCGPARRSFRGA